MSEPFDDTGNASEDGQYNRQVCFDDSDHPNLKRYSRSKLYALRHNVRSQQRPDCASKCNLQTLSFWKFSSGSSSGHDTVLGNADIPTGAGPVGAMIGGSQPPTGSRVRERQLNLRDRQVGFSRGTRASGTDTSFSHANPICPKASFIDQRSNSIAHLMPAFAKKRIAAAAAQNHNHSPIIHASLDLQETRDNEGMRNANFDGPNRAIRSKESSSYEQQRRGNNQSATEYTSPHRRNLNDHERDSGGGINSRHGTLHERRIGSGRLLPRDVNWDYHEKNNSTGTQQRHSSRFADRMNTSASGSSSHHEKGSFDRKSTANSSGNESFGSNAHNRNRLYNFDGHKNDEPEWFSGGPTSQNDIIELRGFDEPIEDRDENEQNSAENTIYPQQSRTGKGSKTDLSQSSSNYDIASCNQTVNSEEQQSEAARSTPVVDGLASNSETETKNEFLKSDVKEKNQENADMSEEFNFDAFLNLDSLDSDIMKHSGTNELQKGKTSGGSRFSRWFAKSKTTDEVPDEKSTELQQNSPKTANVLEFFQNAKVGSTGLQKMEILSVEELESKMRKVDVQEKLLNSGAVNFEDPIIVGSKNTHHNIVPGSQDTEAFKKLLQQLNDGGAGKKDNIQEQETVPPCGETPRQQSLGMFPIMGMIPPPTELPQMLPPPMIPLQQGTHLPINPNDEIVRSNQLKQHRFPQMSPSQQTEMILNTKIPPCVNENFVDQQKRRDFINLMHAVTRGQIPLTFLEKELNNPNIPLHTKEVITAVIRETTRSLTPSLNVLNSNQGQMMKPVHLMRGSPLHQQGGTHSPTMINVVIPTSHTLNQSALTGTEQMPQTDTPIDNSQMSMESQSPQHNQNSSLTGQTGQRHLNSPTHLAFTPTSVLRKMTAEKENTSSHTQQQQGQGQQQFKLLPQMQNKTLNHGVFLNQNQQQLPSAISQPRMILGGNHTASQMTTAQQQQPSHMNQPISPQTLPPLPQNIQHHQRVPPPNEKWQMNLVAQQGVNLNKPMGRPILKGPPPPMAMAISQQSQQPIQILGHLQHTPQQQNQQVPSMMFPAKLDMPPHQTQTLKGNQNAQHILNSQPQPTPQGFVSAQHIQQQSMVQLPQNVLHLQQQQQQQLFQLHHMSLQQQQHMQLQRQLHQQMHPQPNVHSQQQQQHETPNRPVDFTQSQPTSALAISTNDTSSSTATPVAVVCPRDISGSGGLSPTSNQLAQWFSPELLAQASAGKLPQINMNQALSLEEFERNIQHSSAAVHN